MARTPSTMLPLGTKAPDFSLADTEGRRVSFDDARGPQGTLVMFICNHCPYVKHVAPELARLGRELPERGIGVVAVNSNDVESYPDDRPEMMRAEKALRGYTFPYLFDETQAVAKSYQAACTPDFYLFDGAGSLVYRGQLDASRPGNDAPVDGRDLRAAVARLLEGGPVMTDQRPSLGCNIKWKPGQEPRYQV